MFETAVLPNGPKSKRFWTTCIGFTGEALLLGCAVLAPIMFPQVLPRAMFLSTIAPPRPPEPPPGPTPTIRPKGEHQPRVAFVPTGLIEPWSVPKTIAILIEQPPEPSGTGVYGAVSPASGGGGGNSELLKSIIGAVPPETGAPPKPVEVPVAALPKPPAAPVRIKLSSLESAKAVFRPEPVYPPLARQMRVSGVVELVGVIGTDGHMREVRAISGNPLLVPAALAAVRQWIYRPTILSGDPVEVSAPITVTFHLN